MFLLTACNQAEMPPATAPATPVFSTMATIILVAKPVTPAWTDTPTLTPSPTASPTLTPSPTATSTATMTPVPTLDANASSVIYVGGTAGALYFSLRLPVSSGRFWAQVNGAAYNCHWLSAYPFVLTCAGAWLPPETPFEIQLYELESGALVLSLLAPGYARPTLTPTPLKGNPDWTCEVEPLWVPPLTGEYGCYAATCYSRTMHQYVGGTVNSCQDDFPYYLYMTPRP